MNTFAYQLMKQMPYGQNVLMSPSSVAFVLGRDAAGANAETRQQMLQVLGFQADASNETLMKAILQVESQIAKSNVAVANAIFLEKRYLLNQAYLALVNENGGLHFKDFVSNPDGSRIQMNDWVYAHTNQMISNFLPEGLIDSNTVKVMLNALALDLKWQYAYDPKKTKMAPFTLENGTEVLVQMMHQQNSDVLFYQGDEFSALLMPYQDSNMVRLYVVPHGRQKLMSVEQMVHSVGIDSIIAKMAVEEKLTIRVPKLTFSFGPVSLKLALSNMGMPIAFSPEADFSRMQIGGANNLFLSDFLHATMVDEDEIGSRMAAVSASVITRKSISLESAFSADRPFLIYNLVPVGRTFVQVFSGRIYNPA